MPRAATAKAKTAATKNAEGAGVVSLKITLRGIKPPIWRRILVLGSASLADLHEAILGAMGWMGGHLHVFEIDDRQYGSKVEMEDEVADERRLTLERVRESGVGRFLYTYDFGDNWEHMVLVEKRLPASVPTSLPACVAGARNCPPEDCGGPWGYAELIEILADPAHPEYQERTEWLISDFDPERFSVAATDDRMAKRLGRK